MQVGLGWTRARRLIASLIAAAVLSAAALAGMAGPADAAPKKSEPETVLVVDQMSSMRFKLGNSWS